MNDQPKSTEGIEESTAPPTETTVALVANPERFAIAVGDEFVELAVDRNFTPAQIALLGSATPEKFIKTRKGRGGQMFEYIEIHYVIGVLNAIFGFDWSFEIKSHERVERQIIVHGRLTINLEDGRKLIKEQFGSAEIKFTKGNKPTMVDLADDFKAAASDSLKKCASMAQIGWDVYSGFGREKQRAAKRKQSAAQGEAAEDTKARFRTIELIKSNGRKIMVTKFEAYSYFEKMKNAIGKETYYRVIGGAGYENKTQIPESQIAEIYAALMVEFKDLPNGGAK